MFKNNSISLNTRETDTREEKLFGVKDRLVFVRHSLYYAFNSSSFRIFN